MGKNQAYKAMQRARLGSSSAAPEEIEDGMVCTLSYYSFNVFMFVETYDSDSSFFVDC